MIRRVAIMLLVCGGLGFFLQREQGRGTFDAWERQQLAWIQRVHGPPSPPPPVVLVELRRGDLPFESWPPAPLDYALVFESLVRRQPREVVVQPLLAWPGVESLDAATLAERIALLPRGVLACTLQRGLDGLSDAPGADVPLAVLAQASGDVSKVPEFASLGQVPIDELRAGKALGFTRIEFGEGITAHGGTVAVPLVARRGKDLVPSLVLQALLNWQQAAPTEVGVQLGRRLAIGPSLEVPVDDGGRLKVAARLAPPLRRLDAGALLLDLDRDAKLMTERSAELDILRAMEGALVVLGETGENTPRFPVAGAPDGGWTEAEVIARTLVASLGGFHLHEPPTRWQWAGWAGLVVLGTLLLASPRRWLPVFALGGAAALVLGIALSFIQNQWWIPPVPPLCLWLTASVVALLLPPPRPAASGSAVGSGVMPSARVARAASTAVAPIPPAAAEAPGVPPADSTLAESPEPELEALTRELAVDAVPDARIEGQGTQEGVKPMPEEAVPEKVVPEEMVPEESGVSQEQGQGTRKHETPETPPERSGGPKPSKGGRKGHRSGRGRGPDAGGASSGE